MEKKKKKKKKKKKRKRWRTLQEIQIADRSGLRLFRFFTDAYRPSLSLSLSLPLYLSLVPRHSP